MFKKITLSFLSLVLSGVLIEVSLRIFDTSDTAEEMEAFVNSGQANEEASFADITKRHLTSYKRRPKAAHPYFGYVYNHAFSEKFNQDGFLDSTDFSKIDDNEDLFFNVAILGGSVASNFALHEVEKIKNGQPNILSLIESKSPTFFRGKKPRLINLAVDGHKQPQQYFISAYYLEKIQMAITIDGFNEVGFAPPVDFPVEFPGLSPVLFSNGPERNEKIAQISRLIEKQLAVTRYVKETFLKDIFLARKIWQLYIFTTNKKLLKLSQGKNQQQLASGYKLLSLRQRLEKQASVWKKYALLQAQLYRAQNIAHFHFLQPNQHIKGTKILSTEEEKILESGAMFSSVNEGYHLLSLAQQQVLSQGYSVFTLTDIFKNTTETVYSDSCCHLNSLGNDLMRTRIVETILTEKQKK